MTATRGRAPLLTNAGVARWEWTGWPQQSDLEVLRPGLHWCGGGGGGRCC